MAYIEGRYTNYTSRYDVYLFTLRDYTESLNFKYKGTYIERSDMPIHSGYLLQFQDATDIKSFITAQGSAIAAVETFTGDGTEDDFTIKNTPIAGSIVVTVDGEVKTVTTDYTVSTKTITFTTAPSENAKIEISYKWNSVSTSGGKTTCQLNPTYDNNLPVYATIADNCDVVYVGLSEYATAIDNYIEA